MLQAYIRVIRLTSSLVVPNLSYQLLKLILCFNLTSTDRQQSANINLDN
jgi:hypothetical protein